MHLRRKRRSTWPALRRNPERSSPRKQHAPNHVTPCCSCRSCGSLNHQPQKIFSRVAALRKHDPTVALIARRSVTASCVEEIRGWRMATCSHAYCATSLSSISPVWWYMPLRLHRFGVSISPNVVHHQLRLASAARSREPYRASGNQHTYLICL